MLFSGLMTACSPKGFLRTDASESPTNSQSQTSENGKNAENTKAAEPNGSVTENAKGISAPIAIPPSFGNNDPYAAPGNNTAASPPPDLIPGLQPMKGVNVDTLFAEKLKDSDDRFERLENTVVDLRKEINSVMPSIIRLVAIESDIQNLTQELETLLHEPAPVPNAPVNLNAGNEAPNLNVAQLDPQPPPPPQINPTPPLPVAAAPTPTQPAPAAAPTAAQTHSAPVASSATKTTSAFRLGEYADKVRIVIDSTVKPVVTADYDSAENLLVLDVQDSKWIGEMQKTFTSSKLVQSFSVSEKPDGKGATIAVTLKKQSSILKQGTVTPDSNPNHRYYIDMAI